MKRPSSNTLAYLLLGAMLSANLALGLALWNSSASRMDRIEAKVDAIQREYGRIASVEALLRSQDDRLQRIENLLDAERRP